MSGLAAAGRGKVCGGGGGELIPKLSLCTGSLYIKIKQSSKINLKTSDIKKYKLLDFSIFIEVAIF